MEHQQFLKRGRPADGSPWKRDWKFQIAGWTPTTSSHNECSNGIQQQKEGYPHLDDQTNIY